MPFVIRGTNDPMHRVAFGRELRDVAALRPWETVTPENPREGRWDDSYDPPFAFRVLYTSDSRKCAFMEALQDFRPSDELLTLMAAIDDSEELDKGGDETGLVGLSWLVTRFVGTIVCDETARCVEITNGDSIAELRDIMCRNLDAGDLLGDDFERVCRPVSNAVWRHRDELHGITWSSKLGTEMTNYALFETGYASGELRARVRVANGGRVSLDEAEFLAALRQLGLRIPRADEMAYRGLAGRSWDEYLHDKILERPNSRELDVRRTDVQPATSRMGRMLEFVQWSEASGIRVVVLRDGVTIIPVAMRLADDRSTQMTELTVVQLHQLDQVADIVMEALSGNARWS